MLFKQDWRLSGAVLWSAAPGSGSPQLPWNVVGELLCCPLLSYDGCHQAVGHMSQRDPTRVLCVLAVLPAHMRRHYTALPFAFLVFGGGGFHFTECNLSSPSQRLLSHCVIRA